MGSVGKRLARLVYIVLFFIGMLFLVMTLSMAFSPESSSTAPDTFLITLLFIGVALIIRFKTKSWRERKPIPKIQQRPPSASPADEPVTTIVCPKCGKKNLRSEAHCIRCDASLEQQKEKRILEEKLDVPNVTTRCPKCGTERCGDGIYCTQCDYIFSSPNPGVSSSLNPDVSSIPTLVHGLTLRSESPSSPSPSQKESTYERRYISDSRSVSTAGGVILLFALMLLVVAWAWQEDVGSQIENLEYPRNPRYYSDLGDFLSQLSDYNSQLHDLAVSARDADRLWDLGVIIAVFGAAVVAFAKVRK